MADEVLELVENLIEKVDGYKEKQQELISEVQEDLTKKGATIKQILDEVDQIKARGGRMQFKAGNDVEHTVDILKEAFKEHYDKIKAQADETDAVSIKFRTKNVGTMTASANLTGSVQASYASAPAVRNRQKFHFRDLVQVIPSATGFWKFYRQNKPVGEGSFDTQSTHGNTKSQLDYDFTEVSITVDFIAGFVRIAKQMLQDLPFMQSFVANELIEDYLRAEDLKFFGDLYSSATGVTSNVTSTVTVEKIIKVIANLSEDDYDPNAIVITNAGWAKLLLTKPVDYSLPGGNAITIDANGNVMICGVPVLKTKESYIGPNMMLIGDFSKAAIIQAEGLNVKFYEQDSDNVQRNLVTTVCESRCALAKLRLDSFTYISQGLT